MTGRRRGATFSPPARQDLRAAARFLSAEAGAAVARRCRVAVEGAARMAAEHPELGRRFDDDLVPGMRSLVVSGFPYLLVCVVDPGRARVVRVLHGARDLGEELREPRIA